jgi:hypothetical protein
VRVVPRPGTGRHLALAARVLPALVRKAEEAGSPAELIPPDSLGRFATSLQPYIRENILPPESVESWRAAAKELAGWVVVVSLIPGAKPEELTRARAALTLRLQQVDAWPYPSGALVGAFGRALWSLWPRIVRERPERRCAWADCTTMLSGNAHGNRRYCDAHRREIARLRAARVRQRARAGYRLAPPAGAFIVERDSRRSRVRGAHPPPAALDRLPAGSGPSCASLQARPSPAPSFAPYSSEERRMSQPARTIRPCGGRGQSCTRNSSAQARRGESKHTSRPSPANCTGFNQAIHSSKFEVRSLTG